jgi:hypothetical protein
VEAMNVPGGSKHLTGENNTSRACWRSVCSPRIDAMLGHPMGANETEVVTRTPGKADRQHHDRNDQHRTDSYPQHLGGLREVTACRACDHEAFPTRCSVAKAVPVGRPEALSSVNSAYAPSDFTHKNFCRAHQRPL